MFKKAKKLITVCLASIIVLGFGIGFGAQNALADWTTGKFDSAMDFNGTSDYIFAGDLNENVKTISFWIKADSIADEKILDLDAGTHYVKVDTGTLSAQGFADPIIYVDGVVGTTIDTNWHYVAITDTTAIDANSVYLGRVFITPTNFYFDGVLDDIKFYNRVLTAREVAEHYRQKSPSLAQGGTVSGDVYIMNSGKLGIGTSVPDAKLHSIATTEQMRLGYDISNYSSFTINDTGDLTITSSGGDISFDNENILTTGTAGFGATTINNINLNGNTISATDDSGLYLYDNASNGIFIEDGGQVGIGTTTPDYTLDVHSSDTTYLSRIYNTSTNAAAAGLYIQVDGDGNLLTLNADGTDIVTISEAQSTFNNPVSMAAAGDVSVAYDLLMANTTSGNIKFSGPGYIETDSSWQNLDLTLRAANSGQIIVDDNMYISGTLGIGDANPETLLELHSTAPYLTVRNTTEEDADGGRESKIIFEGEQSGGEISALAQIQASHDGTADDEKGDLIFYTNDGDDGSSPTERMRIDSSGDVTVAGDVIAGDDFKKTCATGYIWVPGSAKFGTLPGFCVMKYEAKGSSGAVVSTSTGLPYVSISQEDARTECQGLGLGYHLMSDPEWMTIAENIAHVASNWSLGTIGSGYIFAGHNDNDTAGAKVASTTDTGDHRCAYTDALGTDESPAICPTNDAEGESGTVGNQVRVHTLSNGEYIWDIAGNVWEWTDKVIYEDRTDGSADNNGNDANGCTAEMPDTAEEETYVYKSTIAIEDPTVDDDSFFEELADAATFTSIYCKTLVGTVTLDVQIAGLGINGENIVCDTTGVLDSSLDGDTAGAVGEELKLAITSVGDPVPTYLMVQVNGISVAGETTGGWEEYTSIVDFKGLDIVPPNSDTDGADDAIDYNAWNSADGIGKIYITPGHAYDGNNYSSAYHAFIRGGDWSHGANAGVFALHLNDSPSHTNTFIGFRCAR